MCAMTQKINLNEIATCFADFKQLESAPKKEKENSIEEN